MLQAYWPARDESHLRAPPAWPAELAFIAIGAAWTAAIQRFGLRALGWLPLMIAVAKAQIVLRSEASRRAARRHRLTHLNAPRIKIQPSGLIGTAAILAYALWRRLRRAPPASPLPWTLQAASRIIAAINERRSWRRAFEEAPRWTSGG
jgi:hypothetical protein